MSVKKKGGILLATIEDYMAVSLAQKFLIGIGVLAISFMTLIGITPHGKASISREFNIVIVSLASISFGLYFSIKFVKNLKVYFEIRHHK